MHYYSVKIFPCFWLVNTTHIYNSLIPAAVDQMFNQWHKNCSPLQIIEPVKSKWRQKPNPPADYWTFDQENLGTRLSCIWWVEKQRAKWPNSFTKGEINWMNNKAVIEFGFRRIRVILQIGGCYLPRPSASVDPQNSSYPTQPPSIIVKYCVTW